MRLRVGLAIGFAAGYVLGARAGRERYVQIEQTARKLWESEPASMLRAEIPASMREAVAKVGEIRHREDDIHFPAERLPA